MASLTLSFPYAIKHTFYGTRNVRVKHSELVTYLIGVGMQIRWTGIDKVFVAC